MMKSRMVFINPLNSNLDAKNLPREPEISNHKRVSNFINKSHLVEE